MLIRSSGLASVRPWLAVEVRLTLDAAVDDPSCDMVLIWFQVNCLLLSTYYSTILTIWTRSNDVGSGVEKRRRWERYAGCLIV